MSLTGRGVKLLVLSGAGGSLTMSLTGRGVKLLVLSGGVTNNVTNGEGCKIVST